MKRIYNFCMGWFCLFFVITASAQSGQVGGKVSDASGQGLLGVTIQVVGLNEGTVTDDLGNYQITLPAGTYNFQFSFIGFINRNQQVTVNSGQITLLNVTMDEDVLGLSEVVIVGTRSNDRTIINSTVPVDLISNRDLKATGVTQTIQALQMLVPSYNVTKPSITDGSDHFRPATLRGLGPDQVLVLVNGKRRHTSALVHVNGTVGRGATGVDLNAIPASAIERIEVLRDGASAQYGSDAIAGVINIILKNTTGFDVEATVGTHLTTMERGYQPNEGLFDGITNTALRDNGTLYSYDWLDKTEQVNYSDGQRLNLHLGKGFKFGDGSMYISGQFRHQGRTNRQGSDVRINYFTQPNGAFDAREASFDRNDNFRYGDAQFKDYSLFLNGETGVGTKSTFYVFGGASYRDGLSGCFFRRASDNRTVRSIYPDGFLPLINARITDLSLGSGLKGKMGEHWNYDLSQVVGSDAFALHMQNTHNTSLGGLNQFKFSDADIKQSTDMYDGTLKFLQATTNFDLTRSFNISGFASDLNLALGVEFRHENYGIKPGEISSYFDGNSVSGGVQDGPSKGSRAAAGCQCFPGWKDDIQDNRQSFALYSEVEADPLKRWTTSLAARFEYYTDFGATLNGKFATRLELVDGFALRGAISTGFRAPSLGQSNYSAIQTTTIGTTLIETGFFPVATQIARALGAQDLDPEKSLNSSIGLTFNSGNFVLTVDAYRIGIKDRVILSEQFQGKTGPNGEDLLEQYLLSQGLSAAQGSYFTNALDTRTAGVDVTSRLGVNAGSGKLKFTLSANINRTKITNKDQVTTPAVLTQYSETPLLGDLEFNRFENATPRNVVNFMVNYDLKKFSTFLRLSRYGKTTFGDFNDFGNLVFQNNSPKFVSDLELGCKLSKQASIHLGSNNLFDVYPDKVRKDLAFNGIFQWDGTSPVGFNGRFIYARIAYNL